MIDIKTAIWRLILAQYRPYQSISILYTKSKKIFAIFQLNYVRAIVVVTVERDKKFNKIYCQQTSCIVYLSQRSNGCNLIILFIYLESSQLEPKVRNATIPNNLIACSNTVVFFNQHNN